MLNLMSKWTCLFGYCAIASFGLFALHCQSQTEKSETTAATSDKPKGQIELADLNGQPVAWESFRGKAVFLNLWATWCKPCIMEMPSIERASLQLADSNIVFIAASDESLDKIRVFRDRGEYTFTFLQLKSGFESLGVYGLPTTILFDAKGNRISTETGARDWSSPQAIAKILQVTDSTDVNLK